MNLFGFELPNPTSIMDDVANIIKREEKTALLSPRYFRSYKLIKPGACIK